MDNETAASSDTPSCPAIWPRPARSRQEHGPGTGAAIRVGIAELAEGPAAVEVRADAMGLKKLPVFIKPLHDPPHLLGLDKPGLAARDGMGQAEAQLALQAERLMVSNRKSRLKSSCWIVKPPWVQGPMTARKRCSLWVSLGKTGAEPGHGDCTPDGAAHGDLGEMMPVILQAGRPQEAIGAQRHVETPIKQVEDEVDALRVPGRLPASDGYLPLAGCPEKIRYVDEILPRQRLAARRAGRLVTGKLIGAGRGAGGDQQKVHHARCSRRQALSLGGTAKEAEMTAGSQTINGGKGRQCFGSIADNLLFMLN